MAFRFQKRVKIAPGIRLNLSPRGVSTTVGMRGASVNVGKDGVYTNTGIPGTGISSRKKIAGAAPAAAPRAPTAPTPRDTVPPEVALRAAAPAPSTPRPGLLRTLWRVVKALLMVLGALLLIALIFA